MTSRYSQTRTLFPLLLVLFIDGMGIAILFPILNDIIMVPGHSLLPLHTSENAREVYYGITLGSFFISWFLGTAIISDLSDKIGRKKALLLCLIGTALGYALTAIAIIHKSILLLILGRIIDGFTVGSQPIAQAAIVDISDTQNKTRNLALTLLAPSLGFVIGPLIGGTLSDSHLAAWFNPSIPMIFAALISTLNALILWFLFHETHERRAKFSLDLKRPFYIFYEAMTAEGIRKLSIILFFEVLGWSSFFSFISLYLLKMDHFTAPEIGIYMALVGVGFGIGSAMLTNLFVRYFRLRRGAALGCFITAAFIGFTLLTRSMYTLFLFGLVIGAVGIISYSIMLNVFSNQVDPESQGWVMGITNSVIACAFTVSALGEGFITQHGVELPLIASVLCLLISGVLMLNSQQIRDQDIKLLHQH